MANFLGYNCEMLLRTYYSPLLSKALGKVTEAGLPVTLVVFPVCGRVISDVSAPASFLSDINTIRERVYYPYISNIY